MDDSKVTRENVLSAASKLLEHVQYSSEVMGKPCKEATMAIPTNLLRDLINYASSLESECANAEGRLDLVCSDAAELLAQNDKLSDALDKSLKDTLAITKWRSRPNRR